MPKLPPMAPPELGQVETPSRYYQLPVNKPTGADLRDHVRQSNQICFFFCRLYLINSPVVRAENLRFKEEGVRDVLKDVFLPWYNAYRFLVQNVQRLQKVRIL